MRNSSAFRLSRLVILAGLTFVATVSKSFGNQDQAAISPSGSEDSPMMELLRCNFNQQQDVPVDVAKETCPLRCQLRVESQGRDIDIIPGLEGTHMSGPDASLVVNVPSSGLRFAFGAVIWQLKRIEGAGYELGISVAEHEWSTSTRGPLNDPALPPLNARLNAPENSRIDFSCWAR